MDQRTGRSITLTLKDFEVDAIVHALKAERDEAGDALVYGGCDSGGDHAHYYWLGDLIKRLESEVADGTTQADTAGP